MDWPGFRWFTSLVVPCMDILLWRTLYESPYLHNGALSLHCYCKFIWYVFLELKFCGATGVLWIGSSWEGQGWRPQSNSDCVGDHCGISGSEHKKCLLFGMAYLLYKGKGQSLDFLGQEKRKLWTFHKEIESWIWPERLVQLWFSSVIVPWPSYTTLI